MEWKRRVVVSGTRRGALWSARGQEMEGPRNLLAWG